MSQAVSSASGDAPDPLPERLTPIVEEDAKEVILRYQARQVEKNDQFTCTIGDTDDGNVRIVAEVKRERSDRVVYRHKSNVIPASLNLRASLEFQEKAIKKGYYLQKLVKKGDFELKPHFLPRDPSSEAGHP